MNVNNSTQDVLGQIFTASTTQSLDVVNNNFKDLFNNKLLESTTEYAKSEQTKPDISNKKIVIVPTNPIEKIVLGLKRDSLVSLKIQYSKLKPTEKIEVIKSLKAMELKNETFFKTIDYLILQFKEKLETEVIVAFIHLAIELQLNNNNLLELLLGGIYEGNQTLSHECCLALKQLNYNSNHVFSRLLNIIDSKADSNISVEVYTLIIDILSTVEITYLLNKINESSKNIFHTLEDFLTFKQKCDEASKNDKLLNKSIPFLYKKIEFKYANELLKKGWAKTVELIWKAKETNEARINFIHELLKGLYNRELNVNEIKQLDLMLQKVAALKKSSEDSENYIKNWITEILKTITFLYENKIDNEKKQNEYLEKQVNDKKKNLWLLKYSINKPDNQIFEEKYLTTKKLIYGFILEEDSRQFLKNNQFLLRFSIDKPECLILDFKEENQFHSLELPLNNQKVFGNFLQTLDNFDKINQNLTYLEDTKIINRWQTNLCDVDYEFELRDLEMLNTEDKSNHHKKYIPGLLDIDVGTSNGHFVGKVIKKSENIESNIREASTKEVFRMGFIGHSLTGKSELLTDIGNLENNEIKPYVNQRASTSTTSGLNYYISNWTPNSQVTLSLIDTEGAKGILPSSLDENQRKKWELTSKIIQAQGHSRCISEIRTTAMEPIFNPLIYQTSDIVVFCSMNSISSVSYRDILYIAVSKMIERVGKATKPVLMVIGNVQNDNSIFDPSDATKTFFNHHDPRGELLLYFRKVIFFRLPHKFLLPNTYKHVIIKIKNFIKDLMNETLETRIKMQISISEKSNLSLIQNVFDQLDQKKANLSTLNLLIEVVTPTNNIYGIIKQQFWSLFLNRNSSLKPKKKFILSSEFAILQLKKLYIQKLLLLTIDKRNDLTQNSKESKTFKDLKDQLEIDLTNLNNLFIEFEPCSSVGVIDIGKSGCGLSKTEHSQGPISIHRTHYRITDLYKWPGKQPTGLLAWIRVRMPRSEFNLHEQPWYWVGDFQTSNLIKIKYEANTIAEDIYKTYLQELESNKDQNQISIIDMELTKKVYKAMDGNVISTEECPALPCFVCLKTGDKQFVTETKPTQNPIIVKDSALICCPDCLQKIDPEPSNGKSET